jgi:putative membrane protein insertion efficiency factor
MSLPARLMVALIGLYRQYVSPLMGRHCRYEPTCSAYAVDALRMHGALRGSWLAIKRIGRCHPFSAGGVDHVPVKQR